MTSTLHISQLLANGYSLTDAFSLSEENEKPNRDSDSKQSIYSQNILYIIYMYSHFSAQKKSHSIQKRIDFAYFT